ncbi:flagellar hook capping protein [Mizugakiibacter sediminis]|uniref:Basal-body rod modification protein FlgD n=1 Tax=Mizugakiibacter sediminis TaxID=1475481 RepID=A0A0K8QLE3_9GAMM|nr:flagellar hook assembly protein FlgD [Mizugakiibacter sediminis]GAP65242.1 flagellar hook capping protein [Mizugakiibacter sediminis]
MTDLTTIGNSLNAALATPTANNNMLGQDDFLKLMITQFQNQDPTQPQDPTAFVTQMSQFSAVAGIQQMQASFSALAQQLSGAQVLQAATLVGREVMVPAGGATLAAGGTLGGGVAVKDGGTVVVKITDASGQLVRTLNLGAQPAGLAAFAWDGKDDRGAAAPAGAYKVSAEVWNGGKPQATDTLLAGKVSGVSVGAPGSAPVLQVDGVGTTTLDKVQQIM